MVEQHRGPSITAMLLWTLHKQVNAHTNSNRFFHTHACWMYIQSWPRHKANAYKSKFGYFSTVWVTRTEKWVTLGENTQTTCHVSVYLLWLVLFLALCVHSSAGIGVIYYHLPCQSSPWSPPSISQSWQHCPPPAPPSLRALTACITLCLAFTLAAEETHSDNYSICAMPAP